MSGSCIADGHHVAPAFTTKYTSTERMNLLNHVGLISIGTNTMAVTSSPA